MGKMRDLGGCQLPRDSFFLKCPPPVTTGANCGVCCVGTCVGRRVHVDPSVSVQETVCAPCRHVHTCAHGDTVGWKPGPLRASF